MATYKFKWNATSWPGVVARWLNPREFLTVWLSPDDGKAYLYRQTADRAEEEFVAASSSGVTLTSGQWYDAKVVVHDDSGNQVLDFYVDANQDSDFLDAGEQLFDDEGAIDDNWSAGYVGLANWLETAQEFGDLEVGIDNNSDGDIADAGDDVQIDDDFSSTTMSLSYDDNGNLTDDGIFEYVYDAWNRLVEVTRRVDDETTVAEYEYDAKNRRTKKTVSNCGVEETENDGGNTTVHYYYSGGAGVPAANWNICETRNGSSQTTFQYVWGWQYVDELVLIDKNGDPTESNDCDPDDQSGESTADERYFVHQDRNWNVVALTDYDPSGSDEGNVVERYHYTPYGQFIVLNGNAGNGEMGNVLPSSTVGNAFCFQGLQHDHETGTDQQRHRQRQIDRFLQRDPAGYAGGLNLCASYGGDPTARLAPSGLVSPAPSQEPTTKPSTQPSPPAPGPGPGGQDVLTLWCYPIAVVFSHCALLCNGERIDGTGPSSPPPCNNPNGNGDPGICVNKRPIPDNGWFAGNKLAPPGTCECIKNKGNALNNIPDKSYGGEYSNSNAALHCVLTACGVSMSPSSGGTGWDSRVHYNCRCVYDPDSDREPYGICDYVNCRAL